MIGLPVTARLRRAATGTSDARWRLREATRDLHDRAEAVLGDGPTRDRGAYIAMLGAMLGMTEAVLPAVDARLPPLLTAGLHRDRARLGADLADLGAPVPPPPSGIEVPSRAGALGALYVCEGSKLGARVLARQAEAGLGLTMDFGAAYLNGDGAAAGARWQGFVEALDRDVTGHGDMRDALRAARRVFHLLIDSYEAARWPILCETRGSDGRA
ncbi:MAG: biliverdin-producing heme oxygenase [Roseicyclus sp.]